MKKSALCFLLLLGCCLGCNHEERLYVVTLKGKIGLEKNVIAKGKIYVSLYHATTGEGELKTYLSLFDSFELEGVGEFSRQVEVPIERGTGLVLYAWLDQDQDKNLCAPGQRSEVAGLVEVKAFPRHAVTVEMELAHPCAGPEKLFP